jgi:hypothetical protein
MIPNIGSCIAEKTSPLGNTVNKEVRLHLTSLFGYPLRVLWTQTDAGEGMLGRVFRGKH